ncbi:hypothetical protein [Quisquiliibacterium transsilvanicum]|uniref:CHAT domain-containing protein n=1 Tax=Quisquiliibacterium transsilvanicum TaxID=1549638 RepID=A0A7W8M7M5_9BURK|nr:hypothetical protein [Quisquiliibacterium transsilvanicum]MBB5270913.1 hypothetical protein [Quisquiliibacterium transsilvanicum]
MDRAHLARWSLGLPDDRFPLALAALGALAAVEPRRLGAAWADGVWRVDALAAVLAGATERPSGLLRWMLPTVPPPFGAVLPGAVPPYAPRFDAPRLIVAPSDAGAWLAVDAPDAASLAQAWQDFVVGFPAMDRWTPAGPRLALATPAQDLPQAMGLARLLLRSEVRATGVFLDEAFDADGRIDWRWPFSIATLPGDPLAASMAAMQARLPTDSWPFRYRVIGRDAARSEVLVVGASVDRALAQVLDSELRLSCCLVVVAGMGAESPVSALPLLRALAARVSAEGVAVVEPGDSAESFVGRLNESAYGLSHNRPLDVALAGGFGDRLLLMMGRDLLDVSRLDASMERAADRLRGLPRDRELQLSGRALQRLRLPEQRMRPSPPLPPLPPSASFPVEAEPEPQDEAMADEPQAMAAPEDLADAIDASRSDYGFDHESGEASALSELSRRLEREEIEARRRLATPRHIQQRSFRQEPEGPAEERVGYALGEPVLLRVHIGPLREDSIAAPTAFPEERLPPDEDVHRLLVVFHEPRQFDQPMLGEIELPRAGDSSAADFVFTPRAAGAFEGRITVLHRGRVLQTVLLHTQVYASSWARPAAGLGIRLADLAEVRHDWSDLAKRRRFDLAVVHNHSGDGQSNLTAVAGARAWATRLDGIEQPVRRLNDLLSGVAYSVLDHGDGLDQGENPKLLVALARVGSNLYALLYRDQLSQLASEGFDVGDEKVTHVQVVSARADAVVPLEFLYDYNAPDPDATVCPQHRQALQEGRCPADCARRGQPRRHVCPMGFWGLKKVIERHLFDPKAMQAAPAGAELLVRVEAVEGRDRLDLRSAALLGHSTEVKADEVAPLVTRLLRELPRGVALVKDWGEWMTAVGQKKPALLVAFPHNEGKEEGMLLEIGGGKLYTLDLPDGYVRADTSATPVVFLLGCDVAGTAQDFSSHVGHFRRAGAAVVVSTIATVFGPHAVRVGEVILQGLLEAAAGAAAGAGAASPGAEPPVARIGEALRDARRAALLESLPMAMCVVAFGDADWRL